MAELKSGTVRETGTPQKPNVFQQLTTLSHVCIIGVPLYILYLTSSDLGALFSWHPICFAIGWMLLMTEAVLMISKDNILSKGISQALKVRYHWIIQVVAVALAFAGSSIVYTCKERLGYPHYASPHSIIGGICVALCVPISINGVAALFHVELKQYISPKTNKLIHSSCGILAVFLGSLAMLSSLFTEWFKSKTDGNQNAFLMCFVGIAFGIQWSLVRPVLTASRRLKPMIIKSE